MTQQVESVEEALDSGQERRRDRGVRDGIDLAAATAVQTTYDELRNLDAAGELQGAFTNGDDCEALRTELENIGS